MGPRSISVSRAALAAAAALALVALMGAPAGAQDDLCDALTPTEDFVTAIPGTYDAPGGFSDACQWHGSTVSGDAVDVNPCIPFPVRWATSTSTPRRST